MKSRNRTLALTKVILILLSLALLSSLYGVTPAIAQDDDDDDGGGVVCGASCCGFWIIVIVAIILIPVGIFFLLWYFLFRTASKGVKDGMKDR